MMKIPDTYFCSAPAKKSWGFIKTTDRRMLKVIGPEAGEYRISKVMREEKT